MQGYADQPSMEDGLGRLASRSGKRKHKAWQGIHELGVFSVSDNIRDCRGRR
jgi:hypothetical protein